MFLGITHLRLPVAAVPEAEAYYLSLLGLDLAYRDILVDGEWYGLPVHADWQAADGASGRISVLAGGPLVLVLSDSDPPRPGTPETVGLLVAFRDLNTLRIRVAEHDVAFRENDAGAFSFDDRFGFRWQVGIAAYNDPASMGAGSRTAKWWPA